MANIGAPIEIIEAPAPAPVPVPEKVKGLEFVIMPRAQFDWLVEQAQR